jgi:hypothetical protein
MLEVSKRFKERSFENLKTDLIAKVSIVGGDEITHENGFLSFKILEEAGIASTSMAVATLTLKGFVELIDKSFYLSYGYKFDGEEDYLTFGPYKVVEQSYDEKTKKSTFIAYDLMYEFCKEYKMELTIFPTRADEYLRAISDAIGVPHDISTIPYLIKQDYFNGTGYEVRRAVENLAELSNQIAFFRYGKLTNKSFEEVDVTLTKSNLTGFTILPQFGPVDSLVLSRTPQEDNVYPAGINPETVKHEVKISNNLIVDLERENVVDTLFTKYKNLTLQPFSLSTIGLGFLELGDIVKASIDDKNYDLTILGKELVITNGIKETLFCEEVFKSSTKYQYASDSRRNQITTELLVDKQKGEIKSLIKEVGDRTDKETSLTQDVDSINAKVQSISVGTNLILNLNATLDMVNNTYPYYIFNQNGLQTVFQTIQQTRHIGSPIFRVVADKNSVSGYSKQYEFKGKALATEYAYIVPDTIYSYRCKRTKGNIPMDVYVVEYDGDKKQIKRTKFTLDGQNMIESFSFTPAQMTMWARLEFYNNIEEPFNIAEEMFVRGEPVKWSEDANEVKFYSKSLFEQLSNKMVLSVDSDGKMVVTELGVDPNTGSYFVVKADQIRLEGVITADGNLKIFEDGSIEVNKGVFRGEINTDENVKIGTFLNMPLPEANDILEMIQNNKKGLGGVSWGKSDRENENDIYGVGASITAVKGIKDISHFGTQLMVRAKDAINLTSKMVKLNAEEEIIIGNSGAVWQGEEVIDYKGGSLSIRDNHTTLESSKELELIGGKSLNLRVDKGIHPNNITQFKITANGYDDADNMRIGNSRGTQLLISDEGIGTVALHTPRVGLWLSPSNDINTISLQSKQTNTGFFMDSKGSLLPSGNVLLGWDTHRWQSLYLLNQPNVSSDKRYKYNIHDIDPLLLDSFEELKEKGFVTKHDDKFSYGYIAQDVERCLFKYVTKVWGFKAASEWMPKFKLLQQSESYKSLLYAEVQVIMMAVERRHRERLELEVEQLRREHETLVEILKEKGVI